MNGETLLDFFHKPPFVFIDDKDNTPQSINKIITEWEQGYEEALGKELIVAEPDDLFFSNESMNSKLESCEVINIGKLSVTSPGYHTYNITEQIAGGGNLNSMQTVLDELNEKDFHIYLLSPNQGQAERLKHLTSDLPVHGVLIGRLSSGFISHDDKTALLTDHQIFNRFSRSHMPRKYRGGVSISNFEALNRGDFIVHQEYGVGTFFGIKRVKVKNIEVGLWSSNCSRHHWWSLSIQGLLCAW